MNGKPGVIELVVGSEGIRSSSVEGYADIEAGRPMAMDTLLWMASTGKTITALAFLTLVDEGKVALDDPLADYLPYFRHLYRVEGTGAYPPIVPVRTPVTMRHLLSHMAGLAWLPGFFQDRELTYISLETQSHVYAAAPLQSEPGTAYSYSNAGFNLIGRVIEVISGQRYEDFVRDRFFAPLGMSDTGYHPTEGQLERLARGYAYDRETGRWIRHETTGQMTILPYGDREARHAECGGGLFSTAADMAKYARMVAARGRLDGHRHISADSLREACKRQTPPAVETAYGLGCGTVGFIGHGGAWGTSMSVDPDKQEGTLRLVQKAGEWPPDPDGPKFS